MRYFEVERRPSFFKQTQTNLNFTKDICKMNNMFSQNLSTLIQGFPVKTIQGVLSRKISSIVFDSREVKDDSLFVAVQGFKYDGCRFIGDAITRGASAFITQMPIEGLADLNLNPDEVTAIFVEDCRGALAWVAAEYYGRPSEQINVYGVTGTNGKTTVTYILDSIYKVENKKSGIIGTIHNYNGDTNLTSSITTPESLDINRMLYEMADRKISQCFLEVSSHSLALKRVCGMNFSVGIFTNLSRDHLDFHGSVKNYKDAKKGLFRNNHVEKVVVNVDDLVGREIAGEFSKNLLTVGIDKNADVMAENYSLFEDGSCFELKTPFGSCEIKTNLLGIHNIYNLMSAATGALHQGLSLDQVALGLQSVNHIPGRFERVPCSGKFSIIVDYAHTADALRNVLRAAKAFTSGRIITVFGCGGDRDRGKRKEMGSVAIEGSEISVITSDNPRTEDPQCIIDEILEGVPLSACEGKDYEVIVDRREAIGFAVKKARSGDLIMIAGKGHENYQVLKSGSIYFDDRETAKDALRGVL
jgi:UDP-N-acetylmuramoyl-L-alanyl-D-glutamate--2,6-diaminopimelate ligase